MMKLKVWFHSIAFTGDMKVNLYKEVYHYFKVIMLWSAVHTDYQRQDQDQLTVKRGDFVGLVDKDAFDFYWKVWLLY